MSKNILLIKPETIKDRTGVHFNVDDKLIKPEIKACQDIYIMPILGSELFKRLQDGIENDDLSADEITLLDDYIADAMVNHILADLPAALSYQFYNKGLVRKTSENTDQPNVQEMLDISSKYKNRGEYYGQRLISYLLQNSDTFPEYTNYGDGVDAIKPSKTSYRVSVYLRKHSDNE